MHAVAGHLVAIEQTSVVDDDELGSLDDIMLAIEAGLARICGPSPLQHLKAGQHTTPILRCSIDASDRQRFFDAAATLKSLGRDYDA